MINTLISSFLVTAIFVPLVIGGATATFAKEPEPIINFTKTFTTTQKDEDGRSHFLSSYEKNGHIYSLDSVTVKLLSEERISKPAITYETKGFTGDPRSHMPPVALQKDGNTYQLSSYELVDTVVSGKTDHVESTITYKGVEFIDTIPDVGSVEVVDKDTNQMKTARMPLIKHTEKEEYWFDGFTFPISIIAYDALSYRLGNIEIPQNAELLDYKEVFLSYLGLPSEYYQISMIQWEGEPYEYQGEIRRNAHARGRKLVKDIDAVYGGEILLPPIEANAYRCIYTAVGGLGFSEDNSTVYTMKAAAVYKPDLEAVVEKPLFDRILDWIYRQSIEAICISLLFFIVPILIILCILTRKGGGKQKTQSHIDPLNPVDHSSGQELVDF